MHSFDIKCILPSTHPTLNIRDLLHEGWTKSLENFVDKSFLQTPNLLSLILQTPNLLSLILKKEKVLKCLLYIDISKATGTDGIGPRSLTLSAPHIAEHVTFICNHSINVSVFPNKWKEAIVTPLHKGGPTAEVNNYPPISILPVL